MSKPRHWSKIQCLQWLLKFHGEPLKKYRALAKSAAFIAACENIDRFIAGVQTNVGIHLAPLTLTEVQSLHSAARYGLSEFIAGKGWDARVSIHTVVGRGWRNFDGTTHDLFLLAAHELLGIHGALIARCAREGCWTLFLRQRRQIYCGKRCSRLAEIEKARQKRRALSIEDRYEKRAKAYERRIHRKFPNANIKRRGPRNRTAIQDSSTGGKNG